jgi:hypothetical protein
MGKLARTGFGVACAAVVALEAVALAGWQGWRPSSGFGSRVAAVQAQAAHAAAALPSQVAQEIAQETSPNSSLPPPAPSACAIRTIRSRQCTWPLCT